MKARIHDVFCLRGVWVEEADFWPMGHPETRVEVGVADLTLGMRIPRPFGPDSDAMLAVHATEDPETPGGRITLAITTVIARDVKPPMDMSLLHSNPRRHDDVDAEPEGDPA